VTPLADVDVGTYAMFTSPDGDSCKHASVVNVLLQRIIIIIIIITVLLHTVLSSIITENLIKGTPLNV